jgi:nucleotide-binding universal stress UspA family protein
MQVPQILVATDFSTRSQRAIRRAGQLARQIGAELTLLHVVDDEQPAALVELECGEATKILNEQIASLEELQNVRSRALVLTGEAFDRILIAAANVPADLIVMGSHRRQLLRDVFVGTTIERVVRGGSFPVLMVNTAATHPYQKIVCGMDMSDTSAHAVKTAQTLGLLEDASVTLAHAIEDAGSVSSYLADLSRETVAAHLPGEPPEGLRRRVELLGFLSTRGLAGAGWSLHLEQGTPFQVINQMTTELRPDLLVIGTHGRSGLSKILLGSVAEEIMRSLEIDILAVPPSR